MMHLTSLQLFVTPAEGLGHADGGGGEGCPFCLPAWLLPHRPCAAGTAAVAGDTDKSPQEDPCLEGVWQGMPAVCGI